MAEYNPDDFFKRQGSLLTEALLEMIAESPRAFLRRNYRTQDRIRIKRRRLEQLKQISVSITQAAKPVAAYTGPGDKVGNCAVEIVQLQAEIEEEIAGLALIQQETAAAINLLLADETLRAIMEAYYLSGMKWEEIAYTMHYAYRWVQRLHRRALTQMRVGAAGLCNPTTTEATKSTTKF